MDVVDRLHVPIAEFRDWAMDAIHRANRDVRQSGNAINQQKQQSLLSLGGQLDSLLTALTKGLITDEEYQTRKARLKQEHTELERELITVKDRAEQAHRALENEVVFLGNVRVWMSSDSLALRKACALAFGSNYRLDHKRVLLDLHPLLRGVYDHYKGLEEKYLRIKHNKTLSESTKKHRIAAICATWCRIWVLNQTLAMEEGLTFPNVVEIDSLSTVSEDTALLSTHG